MLRLRPLMLLAGRLTPWHRVHLPSTMRCGIIVGWYSEQFSMCSLPPKQPKSQTPWAAGLVAARAWHAERAGLVRRHLAALRLPCNTLTCKPYTVCMLLYARLSDPASQASPPCAVPLQTVGAMSRTTVPGVAAKGGLQACTPVW